MSWISDFVDATEALPSPPIFRRWTAISLLAATLERRCWVSLSAGAVYPNLYIILIGDPGVGKSVIGGFAVRNFWKKIPDETYNLADTNVTGAGLVDAMLRKTQAFNWNGVPTNYNATYLFSSEFANIAPVFTQEFLMFLTNIWDGAHYSESRRGSKQEVSMDNPCLNKLACTTPHHFASIMPVEAWEQGYAARLIMVSSKEHIIKDVFTPADIPSLRSLEDRYFKIAERDFGGEFTPTPGYINKLHTWRETGAEPKPKHPILANYNARRYMTLIKLSMVVAVSEGRTPSAGYFELNEDDLQTSMDYLFEIELGFPQLVTDVATGNMSVIFDNIYYEIKEAYERGGRKGISKSVLASIILKNADFHQSDEIRAGLVGSGWVEVRDKLVHPTRKESS